MNDQLKHDTAVAAAHAAVKFFPACLLPADREATLSSFTQIVLAALAAYDHFRVQESGQEPNGACGCHESCPLETEAL